ncbi:hypothetical protein MMPV_006295 [Pyropia vietnamensis]
MAAGAEGGGAPSDTTLPSGLSLMTALSGATAESGDAATNAAVTDVTVWAPPPLMPRSRSTAALEDGSSSMGGDGRVVGAGPLVRGVPLRPENRRRVREAAAAAAVAAAGHAGVVEEQRGIKLDKHPDRGWLYEGA